MAQCLDQINNEDDQVKLKGIESLTLAAEKDVKYRRDALAERALEILMQLVNSDAFINNKASQIRKSSIVCISTITELSKL